MRYKHFVCPHPSQIPSRQPQASAKSGSPSHTTRLTMLWRQFCCKRNHFVSSQAPYFQSPFQRLRGNHHQRGLASQHAASIWSQPPNHGLSRHRWGCAVTISIDQFRRQSIPADGSIYLDLISPSSRYLPTSCAPNLRPLCTYFFQRLDGCFALSPPCG